MKFISKMLLAVGLAFCVPSAFAQGEALDMFAAPRTMVLLDQSTTATTTNANYADIHGFIGVAKIDCISLPDNAAGVETVTIQSSADTTNWITLPNVAFGVSNAVIVTNLYYGTTNFLATNVFNLAGTVTTPTASTSGFATPYIGSVPTFSSSAVFTNTGPVVTTIGFLPNDASRYLRFIVAKSGSGTNWAFGAVLTGRKQQQ